jgi:hypothetical protein
VSANRVAADEATREAWRRAAGVWKRRQAELRKSTASISLWMVDAIDPQPGQRIDKVKFSQQYASFEHYWEVTRDLAAPIATALESLDEAGIAKIRDGVPGGRWPNSKRTPEGSQSQRARWLPAPTPDRPSVHGT